LFIDDKKAMKFILNEIGEVGANRALKLETVFSDKDVISIRRPNGQLIGKIRSYMTDWGGADFEEIPPGEELQPKEKGNPKKKRSAAVLRNKSDIFQHKSRTKYLILSFFYLLAKNTRGGWTEQSELCLMATYEAKFRLFRDGRSHHSVLWGDISKILKKANFDFTPKQCSTKIKALKSAYSAVVANQKKTGADPMHCKFYDRLDFLFRKDHNFR
jgi:Myb/SANT-like DNA-binding domain